MFCRSTLIVSRVLHASAIRLAAVAACIMHSVCAYKTFFTQFILCLNRSSFVCAFPLFCRLRLSYRRRGIRHVCNRSLEASRERFPTASDYRCLFSDIAQSWVALLEKCGASFFFVANSQNRIRIVGAEAQSGLCCDHDWNTTISKTHSWAPLF